ncbi:hypothetical protein CcrBL47_gp136 [Caulobacter phage BL47]|nr:hypothetical protein CcrBL47_gp136 [Caulobacter phage BL47]
MPNFTYLIHDELVDRLAGAKAGVLTGAPNPDGTGVFEPSVADGYARQDFVFNVTKSQGVTTISNSQPLVFGPALNQWLAVTYFGLFDGVSGDLLLYGRLRSTRVANAGDSLSFQVDAINIGLR